MNIKHLMSCMTLVTLALSSFDASAAHVDAAAARVTARSFVQQQASTGRSFKSQASSGLRLAHAEASTVVNGANDYYAFNIDGGGWVIIAGEDRATQVLGYSNSGMLDFDNLPYNVKGLLDGYKREIEFLHTYKGNDLVPIHTTLTATAGVDPLIPTNWGQEDPYDWQCPLLNGEYCVVGCVATAMAQVMYYWKFPEGSNALPRFYSMGYGYVSELPATTFDYNQMMLSYCHWDWDNSVLVQDTYTDAQAQAVAKLGRYCGQAVSMQYSPEGSGAYTRDQLTAMKSFGYRSSAQYVQKGSNWNGYSTTQWESMMKTELDAGRPILYAANDSYGAGGHAFICDGYDTSGMFHFNFGWYGTCDGWFVSTALNMTHRDGEYLRFNSGHEMLIGIEPPEGWTPPVTVLVGDVNGDGNVNIADVTALIDYLLSGDAQNIHLDAADVNGDTEVNIADVTALIDQLLSPAE